MKVAPIVAKALSKRGIILRHAPILINEKLVVPSQDKNDLITYSASGRKLIVVKYGFTDEEEGNCAFLILHIENVERVIDLCTEIDTVAKKYETWRNALRRSTSQHGVLSCATFAERTQIMLLLPRLRATANPPLPSTLPK